jgi:hypothetical protein
MSQRDSGYERKERDLYETPEWATQALVPHINNRLMPTEIVFEPACGSGKMVRALEAAGFRVAATDIDQGHNFLAFEGTAPDAVVTNPPYELATEFIDHALRTDFDHAKTRGRLFAEHPAFHRKIVLTKRIRWFEDSKGSPSFNHAWFIWDWRHKGAPTLAYAP